MSRPVPERPRPVFCVIAHAHRDQGIAEAVAAGRFTHAGVSLELGLDPPWLSHALPDDEEWRIEWSKFYYGLDLAHAYRQTGAARFLDAWRRLVVSWIGQVPAGRDSSDVVARRLENWIYAWDGFASAPGFPGLGPDAAARIVASIEAQLHHVAAHLTPERNHRTLELYAILVTALAFPALDPGGTLLEFAIAELHRNLLTDVLPDGVHREASTHYHMIALRSFLGARENARRFGLRLPEGYDERLTRACTFALHCQRPDGEIPALSDADGGGYGELLELAGRLLGREDCLWVGSCGARGVPPPERNASFPLGGYFVQRSGWGTDATPFRDERFLIFDCGPLGDGGHGHYDLLSVEIAARGRPLVVDPGRYTYAEGGPNWRRWFKGTAAHNTVCVDGLDQTPYRRGKPKGPVARGRWIGRWSAPGLDVMEGEATSPAYEVIHRRRVVFVADEYWILEDVLAGERPHRYELRFQLAPEAAAGLRSEDGENRALAHGDHLALVFLPARTPRIVEGWTARSYGVKHAAPAVVVAAEGCAAARFVTVVMPLGPGGRVPEAVVRTQPAAGAGSGATVVELAGPDCDRQTRDLVAWSPEPVALDLGSFRVHARAAWLRERSGETVAFGACDVIEAERTAQARIDFRAPVSAIRWDARVGRFVGATEAGR